MRRSLLAPSVVLGNLANTVLSVTIKDDHDSLKKVIESSSMDMIGFNGHNSYPATRAFHTISGQLVRQL